MDPQKNTLILYGSAGHGHEKAARAVEEACRRARPDSRVLCVDALDYAVPFFAKSYRWFYFFLIDRIPWVWGFFYYFLDSRPANAFVVPLRRLVNSIFGRKLEEFLVSENPDVIVCTHFFPLEVAGRLKSRRRIRSHLMVVVTDYLPHYFWVEPHAEAYVGALPETAEDLNERGIPADRIRALGIPIEAKFETPRRREDAADILGIDSKAFTVLLTSGGAGIGKGRRIARYLLANEESVQVLAVCGNNRHSFEEMSAMREAASGRLKIFGFVNNMDVLMDASDVVIGKSGGLTLTESLAKKKPMVVVRPVPGQETRNARCLVCRGAGLSASSVEDAAQKVHHIRENPAFLARLNEAAAAMARPSAARDIAQWIYSL